MWVRVSGYRYRSYDPQTQLGIGMRFVSVAPAAATYSATPCTPEHAPHAIPAFAAALPLA